MTPKESRELLRKVWADEEDPVTLLGRKFQWTSLDNEKYAGIVQAVYVKKDSIAFVATGIKGVDTITKYFPDDRHFPGDVKGKKFFFVD